MNTLLAEQIKYTRLIERNKNRSVIHQESSHIPLPPKNIGCCHWPWLCTRANHIAKDITCHVVWLKKSGWSWINPERPPWWLASIGHKELYKLLRTLSYPPSSQLWALHAVILICQGRCAHWSSSAVIAVRRSHCFLIESETSLHRQQFLPGAVNLLKACGSEDHRT